MNCIIKHVSKVVLQPCYVPLREDGKPDVCPVDAFAGQSFNVNPFGHIQSDLSALMQAQSKAEYDLIARRLVEAQGAEPDNSGLSDTDLFRFSQGRYNQTPAEVAYMAESIAKYAKERGDRIAREAAEKAKYEADLAREQAAYELFLKSKDNPQPAEPSK